MNLLNSLDGYKVYITGAASVAYGLYLIYTGNVPLGGTTILGGLVAIFGRHTASKIEDKLEELDV